MRSSMAPRNCRTQGNPLPSEINRSPLCEIRTLQSYRLTSRFSAAYPAIRSTRRVPQGRAPRLISDRQIDSCESSLMIAAGVSGAAARR
jgi:hypothetical protein